MARMLTLPHVRRFRAGLLLAAAAFVGCVENPSAQFAWRESTLDLIPEARRPVQKSMVENFGTPEDLAAWERMPVNYGGAVGTVAAPAEGVTLQVGEIAVAFESGAPQFTADSTLLWMSGKFAAGKSATSKVIGLSNEAVLTLEGNAEAAVGDKFAIDFGRQLEVGRKVYMKNCLHCHGVAGDGAGPTASYLNPKPRDYRLGVFKFTETLATERVTRNDLWRVVKYGIPGTYMPSFLLLKDDETHAVIEYIRWLAMRGEMEKRLTDELVDYATSSIKDEYQKSKNSYESAVASGDKSAKAPSLSSLVSEAKKELITYLKDDFPSTVDGTADFIAESWTRAQDPASVITPSVPRVPDTEASRANGRLLYLSDKAKCYTCHGSTGRGNGGATEDFWPKPGSTEKYDERGLHDVWGHVLQPRNLRLGQYRGGRRPVDVFRRVYAGIKGTPMPAFGGTVLKDAEIWDVVNYVMSLPYESESAAPAPTSPQMAARPVQ